MNQLPIEVVCFIGGTIMSLFYSFLFALIYLVVSCVVVYLERWRLVRKHMKERFAYGNCASCCLKEDCMKFGLEMNGCPTVKNFNNRYDQICDLYAKKK